MACIARLGIWDLQNALEGISRGYKGKTDKYVALALKRYVAAKFYALLPKLDWVILEIHLVPKPSDVNVFIYSVARLIQTSDLLGIRLGPISETIQKQSSRDL